MDTFCIILKRILIYCKIKLTVLVPHNWMIANNYITGIWDNANVSTEKIKSIAMINGF